MAPSRARIEPAVTMAASWRSARNSVFVASFPAMANLGAIEVIEAVIWAVWACTTEAAAARETAPRKARRVKCLENTPKPLDLRSYTQRITDLGKDAIKKLWLD